MVGRDVARSLADGTMHFLSVPFGQKAVSIDGVTIPIDRPGITGRLAVDGQGRKYATVIGWDAGSVLVRDDGRLIPMAAGGRFITAIRPLASGVEVYAQDGPLNGDDVTINVYDENGTKKRSFLSKYSSMGILQITGDNTVKSANEHVTTVKGHTVYYAMTVDGWTVGQLDFIPPGGSKESGTLGLISPDGVLFYANIALPWDGYTNMPSHLAVDANGVPYVAINDPMAERPAPNPQDLKWSAVNGSDTIEAAIARNKQTTQLKQTVSAAHDEGHIELLLLLGAAALLYAFFVANE